MTLGERICQLRTRHGLSQVDLADRLAISRQSVSKWETDAAVPEPDKLMRMYRPPFSHTLAPYLHWLEACPGNDG